MSRFVKIIHKLIWCVGLSLVLSVGVPLTASSQPVTRSWQLDQARALLEGAFPDLVGSDEQLAVTLVVPFNFDWLLSRDIQISLRGKLLDQSKARANEDEYLRAHFLFDSERIVNASFIGERVNTAESRAIQDEARAHPDWTDSDFTAALERYGAQFGPTRQKPFLEVLNLDRFRKVMGTVVRVNASFQWRLGDRERGSADIATPIWFVRVETSESTRRHRCYGLIFEPLRGSLISLSADTPCQ